MKKLSILLIIFAALLISCSLNDISGTNDNNETANLEFSISLAKSPVLIMSMSGYLSKSGEDTIWFDFVIEDDNAYCKVKNLKPGDWKLTVNAYNADNVLAYSGSTIVTINPGEETTVYLHLDPATGSLRVIVTWGSDLYEGLVAYYPFNGNANDKSGNGNDGIVYGASLTEDRFGTQNRAYYFDGSDFIDIANSPTLQFTESMTISVWAKGIANKTYNTGYSIAGIVGKANCAPWGIGVDDGDRALFQIYNDSTYYRAFKYEAQIDTVKWYHYVGVFKSGKYLRLYINGKKVGEIKKHIPKQFNSSTDDIWIGTRSLSIIPTIPRYFFKGIIDDIRIYDRALSGDEIYLLYQEDE